MSKKKGEKQAEKKPQRSAKWEEMVHRRYRLNVVVSIVLAVVVTLFSVGDHGWGMALLRGGGIGLATWLFFYINYRYLLR